MIIRLTRPRWSQREGLGSRKNAKDDPRSVMIQLITQYLSHCLCGCLLTMSHIMILWCLFDFFAIIFYRFARNQASDFIMFHSSPLVIGFAS
jgi:hypothetical protein